LSRDITGPRFDPDEKLAALDQSRLREVLPEIDTIVAIGLRRSRFQTHQ